MHLFLLSDPASPYVVLLAPENDSRNRSRIQKPGLLRVRFHTRLPNSGLQIRGVLEAEKEDELAYINPEDFKRMEKKFDDFRRRKAQGRSDVWPEIEVALGGLQVLRW